MTDTFYIPDRSERDNDITSNDVDKGYLRVGVNNKKYFPNEDCDVTIIVKNISHICKLRTNNKDSKQRSYKLHLGKELMNKLNIKPSSTIEIQKITEKEFKIL